MIYLGNLMKITDTKYSVGLVHYQPFDSKNGLGKTQTELEQTGILVDSITAPTVQEGKSYIMYVNPATKEIIYEYVDIPKSQEQIIVDLQAQNAQMLLALVNGGLM